MLVTKNDAFRIFNDIRKYPWYTLIYNVMPILKIVSVLEFVYIYMCIYNLCSLKNLFFHHIIWCCKQYWDLDADVAILLPSR